jgi:uncharacterized membrane protein
MGLPKIGKTRLEAFSDGVIAIIITIMVLELKVPHASSFDSLIELYPIAFSYVLSYIYIAIYWNNHHHMLHTCSAVSGLIMWANLHLLFWLSLIPFATAWMGENHFATTPTQFYGLILFMAGFAYYLLSVSIISFQGPESLLKKALGSDWKGKASPLLYLLAIVAGHWSSLVAVLIYAGVALIWVVPDPRIGKL